MDLSIRPHEIAGLLDMLPPSVRTLSLDCFDTLVWRNVNAPTDVFAALDFPGGGLMPRTHAESELRKAAQFQKGSTEVTLPDIYATLMPGADDAARAEAMTAELAAEAGQCFIFSPVRELIVEAKRRGLRVVIVSDTYLSEPQLGALIASAGGQELADMIDRIFCSCEHGRGKAEGLFPRILSELGQPDSVAHVGDNQVADQQAPAALGIHTVHIQQFEPSTAQRLRLETVAATLLDPATRHTLPALQPHRPSVALRKEADAAYVLGHDVLGPILHGYAGWLEEEARALEASVGKPVRILFLLRDGYLPHRVFRAMFPAMADRCVPVELSRYTATAASFTSADAVRNFLNLAREGDPTALARQLLFTPEESRTLSSRGMTHFLDTVRRSQNIEKIVRRSGRFAARLRTYLKSLGVEQGDAVIFADLGYEGTVQNQAEPVLREQMGLQIAGRYLLLREHSFSGLDKRGYFDASRHDWRTLDSLTESIAIVEQMVTVDQGSVIDYREDGAPIRKAHEFAEAQSAIRDRVQRACLDYVTQAADWPVPIAASDTKDARRSAAAAILARLLFLPIEQEVELLRDFYHDMNLGTDAATGLLDLEAASNGLRRRGLFYSKNAARMYLPGELQPHGLPINLSIFGARRFGLELRKSDFDVGALTLPLFAAKDGGLSSLEVEAHPTADGYYQALIPVGRAEYTIGLRLGSMLEWFQLEEACFLYVDNFMKPGEEEQTLAAQPVFDSMEEMAPGLFRCLAKDSILLVPAPVLKTPEPLVLSIVFRPIRKQPGIALRQAA